MTEIASGGGKFAPAMSYPRRQQYRHIARTVGYALAVAVLAALSASRSGGETLTGFTLMLAAGFTGAACRSQRLAKRWRVGRESERAVQHALEGLAHSGWAVRNGVARPGGGDVDHLVRSPNGLGSAIETKTRTFSQEHLRRTVTTVRWAGRSRRRYAHGWFRSLCVVRGRRVESRYGDVVVVSLDRLLAVLEHSLSASNTGRTEPPNDARQHRPRQNPGLGMPRATIPRGPGWLCDRRWSRRHRGAGLPSAPPGPPRPRTAP